MSGRGCRNGWSRTRPPATRAELADSLSLALLVLLERLSPVERAAYVLRELGYDYAEIAEIIQRTEVNSRQLVTRARKHLEADRPRFDADEAARDALRGPAERPPGEAERRAAEQLFALMRSDDVEAKQLVALVRHARAAAVGRITAAVPEQPAEVRVLSVLTVDVVGGRIQTVRIVRNPDKLGHL
jgi:RNA polymerase sigma-70 factor (ECF subfamily)